MANVLKKHSISSELAQNMVNAAVAKAREPGVAENTVRNDIDCASAALALVSDLVPVD
jgi:uncharacterized protein GlcG (DUF336 family)